MKKVILAGLLVLAAVIAGASYLLPERFVKEETTDVAAPASYLYEELNDLERWPRWSYWFDENTAITYGDKRAGITAHCTWKTGAGPGTATLAAHKRDEMVRANLEFSTGTARYEFTLVPDTVIANQTQLTIKAEVTTSDDNSIWRRWKRYFLARQLTSSLTHNIATLKRVAESKPIFDNITEELLAPAYYVSVKSKRQPDAPAEQVRTLHAQVMRALKSVGSKAAGHPLCLFSDSSAIEFGVPIEPDARVPDAYTVNQLYSGPAIRGIDNGGYEDITDTHKEVQRYIQYKDYVINGPPWEVYNTDPAEDPSTWTTEVYYPVTTKEDVHDTL